MENKIYVQIPAYRDSELIPTLYSLVQNATHPENLRICLFWQYDSDEQIPKELSDKAEIEIIKVHYKESNGCNWARNQMQKQWKNETFTLLIDSHHRFIKNWDNIIIDTYYQLKNGGVSKPLITAYLPPYDPLNDPGGRSADPLQIFKHSREKGLLIYLISHRIPFWEKLKYPIKANYASLHFIFTEGAFNKEIVFDPEIYFFGDEVITGLKAYTMVYDLYHPHFVVGWHLYNRNNTRITHWNDHKDWQERHEKSHDKIRDIYLGITEDGIGKVRSVEDYEIFIGDKLLSF